MDAPIIARELAQLLKHELHALGEFLQLLLKEQDTLARGAREKIGAEIEDKARLLQELTRHAHRRGELLQAQQCPPTRAGMEACLSQASGEARAEAAALWQSLLRLTQRAFQVNHTNGLLIESRLRANQGAIGVLCDAVNPGQVYGHDGRPRPRLGARRWGTA